MIILFRYKKIFLFLIILIIVGFIINKIYSNNNLFLGGAIKTVYEKSEERYYYTSNLEEDYSERYQRPSKNVALNDKYSLFSFINDNPKMSDAKELVYAYYGILKEASNMEGYTGGCGTIGDAKIPYPYAYNLLSSEYKDKISLKEFESSFEGIGHITLLKVDELSSTDKTKDYFVEIEVIKGAAKNKKINENISFFAYYYGIISTIKENSEWRINNIDYYPEDFLCAPYHGWSYDAKAIMNIIYKENLGVIDEITDYNENNDNLNIYATKGNNKYRFDFIRLTNGYDILVQENIMKAGSYLPIEIISNSKWKYLKLSPKKSLN